MTKKKQDEEIKKLIQEELYLYNIRKRGDFYEKHPYLVKVNNQSFVNQEWLVIEFPSVMTKKIMDKLKELKSHD